MWSKANRNHIERLINAEKLKPAGLKQVVEAKKDGRWKRAYDSSRNMTLPQDFIHALSQNNEANEFFDTLSKADMYAIGWRLQTAVKPETRIKRMESILGKLSRGEKFH